MKRIDKIMELISETYFALIDIGSDHGYLGIKALKSNKIQEVWNIEISKKCLDNTKKNFEKFNYVSSPKPNSYFYLSDGFNNLKHIPDNSIAVIAGLGTKTMLNILNNNLPSNLNNIICLPHNPPILLRKWALENNWDIVSELYFEDKQHIYLIIKLRRFSTHVTSNSNMSFKMQNKASKVADIKYKTKESQFKIEDTKNKIPNMKSKAEDVYIGKTIFLESQPDLSFKYWSDLTNRISSKPKEYLLNWEKKFLLSWNAYKESIKLK